MKRIVIFALMITLVTTGLALGAMRGSADVVKAAASPVALKSAPGERVSFEVKMDIQEKWHIYAHADTNFIGVDLVPDEGFILTEFEAEYPAGHEGEFFGDKVVMIEGKDVIKASALVPADLAAGEHELAFSVTVQACDDKMCLAPAYLPVVVKLTVE
jgi:hypothetical protein